VTNEASIFGEFLLRVGQYWAAAASLRDPAKTRSSPAAEQVAEVLLRFWKAQEAIAAGKVPWLRFYPDVRALRIDTKPFEDFLGSDIKRPFKIFYEEGQFYRGLKRFAKSPQYRAWRKFAISPDVTRVAEFVARVKDEVGVDLIGDRRFVGTLVQQTLRRGVVIGFKDLPENVAFLSRKKVIFNLPSEIDLVSEPASTVEAVFARSYAVSGSQLRVIRAGDRGALRSLLLTSLLTRIVEVTDELRSPLVEQRPEHRLIHLTGKPGSGKSTAAYHLLATHFPDATILAIRSTATGDDLSTIGSITRAATTNGSPVVVLVDDLQRGAPSLLGQLVTLCNENDLASLVITSWSSEPIREQQRAWFAPPYVWTTIDLDKSDLNFVRALVTRCFTIMERPYSKESVELLSRLFWSRNRTPHAIINLLSTFGGNPSEIAQHVDYKTYWAQRFAAVRRSQPREALLLQLIGVLRHLGLAEMSLALLRLCFSDLLRQKSEEFSLVIGALEHDRWVKIEGNDVFIDDVQITLSALGLQRDKKVDQFVVNTAVYWVDHDKDIVPLIGHDLFLAVAQGGCARYCKKWLLTPSDWARYFSQGRRWLR